MLFRLINVLAFLFHNALFAEAQGLCRAASIADGIEEECGKLPTLPTPRIPGTITASAVGGRRARREEVPWHAGIYSKRFEPFMQICGGSVVSKSVVISAAHCFMNGQRQDFAVAAGKLFRPWNDEMDKNAQKSEISQIRIPPRYHGPLTNFQDDLALVIMATPFVFNDYVQPICLDFDYSMDNKHLVQGNMGMVAGWGRTDANGKASPTLQVVKLPSVDVQRCFDEIEPVFRPAITSDKICAGNDTAGTAVCMGDSGGGLSFAEDLDDNEQRFYLRGVVSTAPNSVNNDLCNVYTYATFTHIIKHEHFIREVILGASSMAPDTNQTSSASLDQSESRPQTKPADPEERNSVNAQPLAYTGIQTDLTTERRPFLSQNKQTHNEPTQSTQNKPNQSSENQQAKTIGVQPAKTIGVQPAQRIGVLPANSTEIQLAPSIGVQPAQTIEVPERRPFLSQNKPTRDEPTQSTQNKPNQSSENQQAQTIGVQPAQRIGVLPENSIGIQLAPTIRVPAQRIGVQPVHSIGNQLAQTLGVQPANFIGNQLAQTIGIRPAQSTEIRPHRIDYHLHGYVQYPHPNGNPHDYQYKHHYQYKLSHPYQHKHQHQPGYQYKSGNLSAEHNPNQYSENRSAQKAYSIENQPGQTLRVPPAYSIENQPGQTIRFPPASSIANQPGQSIGARPGQNIDFQPSQSSGIQSRQFDYHQHGYDQYRHSNGNPHDYRYNNHHQLQYGHQNQHENQYQPGHHHHQHGHNTHGQGYNYQSPQQSKLPGQW